MENKQTNWMKFLGGKNIFYTFGILFLVGLTILLYSQLDFILRPIFIVMSTIITPLVISFILYYLLSPIVDSLEKRGVKRVITIIIIYLVVIGLLSWLVIWLFPILQQQFNELVESIPQLFNTVVNYLQNAINNISLNAEQREAFDEGLSSFEDIDMVIIDYLSDGFSGVTNIISSVTNVFVIMLIVPVILFFFLKDGSRFIKGFMNKVPPGRRTDISAILRAIDSQVGSYIKGQIIVALANGILMFIGFSIIGLNYNGILAFAGGILSFIPYLGPTLTFIPAAVIALTDSFWMVGKLVIVWGIVQFIEGNLIEPNILGNRLNVHPVTIILILLIMGELLGLVGMILGVPIYAILKVIATYIFQRFQVRYNKYYGDEEGTYKVKTLAEIYELED
ncbi:MAG TPA: AI-2E family transporter [Atopostipes sp.]|nr:AI-2E family transporter [Atopostipes sp.]